MISAGESLLGFQLDQSGIFYEREYRFAPPRRFRFDFVIGNGLEWLFAVEIDGGAHTGGHRRHAAADSECEKNNLAQMDGWLVLHFTPPMVESGVALELIRQALEQTALD